MGAYVLVWTLLRCRGQGGLTEHKDNRLPTDRAVRVRWYGWLIALACALTLYVLTLAPDVVWQDQGDYQVQAAQCNLNRPGDVVRVHPLFIVTAHLVGRLGIFSYAYAANLVSAVFAAVTVANVYLLVYMLTGRTGAGALSAAVLALAHSIWFLGVQAQTYSMANAAMSLGLVLTLAYLRSRRPAHLWAMGAAFGLGISAHIMSQIGFAVIMVWLLGRVTRRQMWPRTYLGILLAWAAGAALLWIVMAIEYQRSGDLWSTITSALWGRWERHVFNVARLGILLKRSAQFFVLNFPTPLVLLAVPGILLSFRRLAEPVIARLLLWMAIVYGLFAVRYDVPNMNNFFLPMYLLVAVYVGLGWAFLVSRRRLLWGTAAGVLLLCIPPTYYGLSELARGQQIPLGTRRHIPYRDEYAYYLRPWQHNQTGPRRLAEELFAQLPPRSILLADMTTLAPLQYVHHVEGKRPDLYVLPLSARLEKLRVPLADGVSLFTVSDVPGYYPKWARADWLHEYPISAEEHIFRIGPPNPVNVFQGEP